MALHSPVRAALLCELNQDTHAAKGGTYIVITHDILTTRRIAEYIGVMGKGRIVEAGLAADVLDSPDPFVRQFLDGDVRGPLGME